MKIKIGLLYFFKIIITMCLIFFYYLKKILNNFSNAVEGSYIKIHGDINQYKYLDVIKDKNKIKYIYYDDNHNIVENGLCKQFLLKEESITTHIFSLSKCYKIFSSDKYSISVCNGYARKKFNELNTKYESFHRYYKVNGKYYYKNTYFFKNHKISSAIYKLID